MNLAYQFTPYALPMLASAAFMAALGVYAWRHRALPGALPFAIMELGGAAWAVGAAMQLAAVDVSTQIFWFQFQSPWRFIPNAAGLYFALEYAHLDRWLNRRTIAFLAAPLVLLALFILTNDVQHWMWLGFTFDGSVQPVRGVGNWILIGYTYVLIALTAIVLLWLFVRSPLHRLPVALIVTCRLSTTTAYLFDIGNRNPFAPLDLSVLVAALSSIVYAFALFHLRMLDLIPIARETVRAQMQEGMLVLDNQRRIVDLNPAAENILGVRAGRVRGQQAQCLSTYSDLATRLDDPGMMHSEIQIRSDDGRRTYSLHLSSLKDERSLPLGYLILFQDVTEQQRVQAERLQNQHVVATLQERERLGRELHDSLGQVLASAHLQAETAQQLLAQGKTEQVAATLTCLAEMTQAANADVREYLLGVKTTHPAQQDFLATLREYLRRSCDNNACPTELIVPPELETQKVDGIVAVQLLRIIQEGLTNVRKHALAKSVQITFEHAASALVVTLADDGCGFDPARLADSAGYGLRAMRERAESVGGKLEVHSAPGQGTRVVVNVPLGK